VDLPPAWDLSAIQCVAQTPGGGTQSFTGDGFTLFPGLQTDCTITNATSTVTIAKVTNPAGSTQEFEFTLTDDDASTPDSTATLSDGETSQSFAFAPGSVVDISEAIPDGWGPNPTVQCIP